VRAHHPLLLHAAQHPQRAHRHGFYRRLRSRSGTGSNRGGG
jgi:hypothetical protein